MTFQLEPAMEVDCFHRSLATPSRLECERIIITLPYRLHYVQLNPNLVIFLLRQNPFLAVAIVPQRHSSVQ
jgi:hypothetical protein